MFNLLVVINNGLFANLKPFKIKVKWIPCGCGGLLIPVAFQLTAFYCGIISPWSDSSGLLTGHACAVLPSPVQSSQWCQSSHSEHANLLVPFLCFLSMAYPFRTSPSATSPQPSLLPDPVSTPFILHTPALHAVCFFMLFPGVSAQYPRVLPSNVMSINPFSVNTSPPILPPSPPTLSIINSSLLSALHAKLTLLGHYQCLFAHLSCAFYFPKPGYLR